MQSRYEKLIQIIQCKYNVIIRVMNYAKKNLPGTVIVWLS